MVFNVILVNQDDHVKNISFLMDRQGRWSLAPAYDITFSYDADNQWLRAHQMLVNGKNRDITREDLLAAGKTMGISKQRCSRIIAEVEAVAENFSEYFEQVHVSEQSCEMLLKIIQKQ
jgi:serine/threonine-protein kinase HipA